MSLINLTSFIKHPTCYKNPNNLTCIDLILSNTSRGFQSTCVIETGLSDFHSTNISSHKNSCKKFHLDLSIIGPTKTSQMKPLGSVY